MDEKMKAALESIPAEERQKMAAIGKGNFEPTKSDAELKLQQHIKETQDTTNKIEGGDNSRTMSNDAMARALGRQADSEVKKEGQNLANQDVKTPENDNTKTR